MCALPIAKEACEQPCYTKLAMLTSSSNRQLRSAELPYLADLFMAVRDKFDIHKHNHNAATCSCRYRRCCVLFNDTRSRYGEQVFVSRARKVRKSVHDVASYGYTAA